MPIKIPPPPNGQDLSTPSWRDWFFKLAKAINDISAVTEKSATGVTPVVMGDVLSAGEDGGEGMIPGPRGIPGPDGRQGPVMPLPEDPEEPLMIPGPPGLTGSMGNPGSPGADGGDGEDGLTIPGPQGIEGPSGKSIPGADGADGESFWYAPGLPPPINSTGVELRQEVTGLIKGGILSATPGGTTFNITAGIGQVIDNYTNSEIPQLTPVSWTAFTNVTDVNLTNDFTYVYINSAGSITQATTVPVDSDLRTAILIGIVVHSGGVVSASAVQCVVAYQGILLRTCSRHSVL